MIDVDDSGRPMKILHAAIMATLAAGTPALADDGVFDELRFGASASIQGGGEHEDGIFPEFTLFFDPFGHDQSTGLQKLARPRIHLGTSIGTSGSASQVFTGFSWTADFSDKLFAEAGFGGVIHTGDLDSNDNGPALGCRLLFHEYIGAGFRFDSHWNVIAQVAHSSHANLCDGPNNGMTRAGLQLGYKF
ncbi:lipid A 3-O-deacylase [Rhizobium sp. OAE497]